MALNLSYPDVIVTVTIGPLSFKMAPVSTEFVHIADGPNQKTIISHDVKLIPTTIRQALALAVLADDEVAIHALMDYLKETT